MNKGVGEYTLSERLGKGSYAEASLSRFSDNNLHHAFLLQVFKALHKPSREEFAIKVIERRKLTPKLQENLESEIKIMRDHHHPNIVQLFDILVSY
jgi:serine/threonine protein kinase